MHNKLPITQSCILDVSLMLPDRKVLAFHIFEGAPRPLFISLLSTSLKDLTSWMATGPFIEKYIGTYSRDESLALSKAGERGFPRRR